MDEETLTPVGLNEVFAFACSFRVPCFNECCRALNQFLTPYDILRLKGHLQMDAEAFLARYTNRHMGPATGLPVVSLKGDPDRQWACPFVADTGCRVYENRPSSCRSYPLTRLAFRNRETGAVSERYFLLQESHCRGFEQNSTQTVARWVASQGLAPYNIANDRFMEIVSLKNQYGPTALSPAQQELFESALYDLDGFRSRIFQGDLAESVNLSTGQAAQLKTDDAALLDFSIDWVKGAVFQHPGMTND